MAGMSPAGNIPSGASDQEKVSHTHTHFISIYIYKEEKLSIVLNIFIKIQIKFYLRFQI